MRKTILSISILLVLLLAADGFAQPYHKTSGSSYPGVTSNGSGGLDITGSVSMPTASVPDMRGGVSPIQRSGSAPLTTAEMNNRTLYLSGAAGASVFVVPLPYTATAAGTGVFLMDSYPDSGLTLFSVPGPGNIGVSLWADTQGTGTTLWFPAGSGASGWRVYVFPTIRAGKVVYAVTGNAATPTFNIKP